MNIAIDISPLKTGHFLQHRVRGTGFYLNHLKTALEKYFPNESYTYFTQGEKLSNYINIVHFPYFEPFFLTLPIRYQYPSIVTVHDLIPFVFPNKFPAGIKGKLKWQRQKYSLKNAKAIITDSQSSKNDIIKYGGISANKVHVVYLAAGEEFKQIQFTTSNAQLLKKKYKLPDRFALYVGDVTWNKNLPRIIEATSLAKVPLVLIGNALNQQNVDVSNSWNQDLVQVQQLINENKNIIKLGFVPTEDLVQLYNLTTVFVMPSLYEGFGLPILEAMQCGTPVISSHEGSLKEIAADAAYIVDAFDANSIAQGITKVFGSPQLQKQLSQKGLAHVRQFSWEKTATQTMAVYKTVKNV